MKKDFSEHIKALIEELKDPEYYYSWQANIAMAFKDEIDRAEKSMNIKVINGREHIHDVANNAAKNFLDILMCKYCELAEEVGL